LLESERFDGFEKLGGDSQFWEGVLLIKRSPGVLRAVILPPMGEIARSLIDAEIGRGTA
jgi:hypothetical protein